MADKFGSRWSGEVTEHSDALDLGQDVFKSNDPDAIAKSLQNALPRPRGLALGKPERHWSGDSHA